MSHTGRDMPTLKANHRQILAAKPVDWKTHPYRIQGVRGLMARRSPSGAAHLVRPLSAGGRQKPADCAGTGSATPGPSASGCHWTGPDRRCRGPSRARTEIRMPSGSRGARRADGRRAFQGLVHTARRAQPFPRLDRSTHSTGVISSRCSPRHGAPNSTRVEIGRFRDKVAKNATPLTSNTADELVEPFLQLGPRRGHDRVQSRRPPAQVGVRSRASGC